MRITEALDGWEIEIALSATCSRCKAPTGQRCVVPESDTPSHIHPWRLRDAYESRSQS